MTKLLRYEAFANNANEMITSDTRHEISEAVKSDGLYLREEFNIMDGNRIAQIRSFYEHCERKDCDRYQPQVFKSCQR